MDVKLLYHNLTRSRLIYWLESGQFQRNYLVPWEFELLPICYQLLSIQFDINLMIKKGFLKRFY